MKSLYIFFLFIFFSAHHLSAQTPDSLRTSLTVSIPQRSGLAFADFKHYQVNGDSLIVAYEYPLIKGSYKKLASYLIPPTALTELDSILSTTDSLGHHTSSIFIMGRVRFLISASYQGKKMNGYIANCYRPHIFCFIDWLNQVYPEGDILSYDKTELLKQEEENDF